MSLILTEISNVGIAMVADSAISMLNPKTLKTEAHERDWLKLLKVPRLRAAVFYWGNIGAVSGASRHFEEGQRAVARVMRKKSVASGNVPAQGGT